MLFIYCISSECLPGLGKTTAQEVEEEGRKLYRLNTVKRVDTHVFSLFKAFMYLNINLKRVLPFVRSQAIPYLVVIL